jgi:hypothetical protein
LAHLALKDLFGVTLPARLMCAEMFLDREYFRSVSSVNSTRIGDLAWFGPHEPPTTVSDFRFDYREGQLVNAGDFPVKHVAVFSGLHHDQSGEPLLLHTSKGINNCLWPLSRFMEVPRYQRLYEITRFVGGQASKTAMERSQLLVEA